MSYTKDELKYMGLIDQNGYLKPIDWRMDNKEYIGINPLFEYEVKQNHVGNWCAWASYEWCLGCCKTVEQAKLLCESHYKKEARMIISPTISDRLKLAVRWLIDP